MDGEFDSEHVHSRNCAVATASDPVLEAPST